MVSLVALPILLFLKKPRKTIKTVAIVCVVSFFATGLFAENPSPTPQAEKVVEPIVLTEEQIATQEEAKAQLAVQQAAEERQKAIASQFSAWDGSHYELTKLIKLSMNDPKSYEHVSTSYLDHEDYLTIMTTFRGKNAFGGVVPTTVKAKVSITGGILEILDQE